MSNRSLFSSSPSDADRIFLYVGERYFGTVRATLVAESGFFASLLSGLWENTEMNRSHFIDADGDLFEHILRYLRLGVFPLFYDKAKGHNYAPYLARLAQAKLFQIKKLEEWLEKKQYLSALRVEYSATESEGTEELNISRNSDVELEYYPVWGTKEVYVCPRGLPEHRGEADTCVRDCMKVQVDEDDEDDADDRYEEESVLRTLVVEKKTIFDMQGLLGS